MSGRSVRDAHTGDFRGGHGEADAVTTAARTASPSAATAAGTAGTAGTAGAAGAAGAATRTAAGTSAGTNAGTAVTIDRVSFAIGGAPVLQEVSGHLPAGALTGLLGPNGAGKSTLLRLIAGIETPSAGSILLREPASGAATRAVAGAGTGADATAAAGAGIALASLPRREVAKRIALLEQTAVPNVDLSVLEVVLLGRIPHRSRLLGSFGGDDDRQLAIEALAAVGSADLAERGWHTLSGGQQQRVQIARALAQQPTILLLDEPTNHLDISAQLSLLAQVRGLGLTSVAALHDLNLAAAYCDHIVLLQEGRVVAAGPPEDVLRPEIIASVYGVDCDVIPHPRGGHPVIVYSPPTTP